MIAQLMVMMVVATTCSGTLVSPLDKGVMGKVSKEFLKDFANEVADKISTRIKVEWKFIHLCGNHIIM